MRKAAGYILFVLSLATWAVILLLPFAGISASKLALVTTFLIIVGELSFVISVSLLGKDILKRVIGYLKHDKNMQTNSFGSSTRENMNKRYYWPALIICSLVIWLIDRGTLVFSNYFGKMFCGDDYMQPVAGSVGDGSCGFNADMYLFVFLLAVFMVGVIGFIITKSRS